jgi:hypothetical protein
VPTDDGRLDFPIPWGRRTDGTCVVVKSEYANWLDYAVFVCVPVSRDKDWLEGYYSCGYKGASCSHVDVSASSGTVEEIGRGGNLLLCVA